MLGMIWVTPNNFSANKYAHSSLPGNHILEKILMRRVSVFVLSLAYLPSYAASGKIASIRFRQLLWGKRLVQSLQELPLLTRGRLAILLVYLARALLDLADVLLPSPQPVSSTPLLVCSPEEALAYMDEALPIERVEFRPLTLTLPGKPRLVEAENAPVEVATHKQRKGKAKKVKVPGKRKLALLSDAQLLELGRELGIKGLTKRMKRDTLLWRITCHKS